MDKMHVSKFCGIKEDGTKAVMVTYAFEMFQKALKGEFEMDKSQAIHNHVGIGTVWMFANLAVDLGFANTPKMLTESYKNVMNGEAATPIGAPHFDSVNKSQTKTSAPGLDAWNKMVNPGYTWSVMSKLKVNKVWPDKFSLVYFNPVTEGREGGTIEISTDDLFDLNPQWQNKQDLDMGYCVSLPADRETGIPKLGNKYERYIV